MATTLAEINVIPLVDVMLVLLIIFMVAAPMLQRGVEVNLPQLRSRSQEIASERLFVDVPLSFQSDQRVYLGKEAISLDGARRAAPTGAAQPGDKQVFLRIDRGLLVQKQFDVFDAAEGGGRCQRRPGDGAADRPR